MLEPLPSPYGRGFRVVVYAAWLIFIHQIGYVGQEPVLFAGSIASNIANGKNGASHEESEFAHDFFI